MYLKKQSAGLITSPYMNLPCPRYNKKYMYVCINIIYTACQECVFNKKNVILILKQKPFDQEWLEDRNFFSGVSLWTQNNCSLY